MNTVKIVPTWRAVAPLLYEIIRNAKSAEAQRDAYDELLRMAETADLAVAAASAEAEA